MPGVKKFASLLVIAMAAGLLLAGCGGGGDDEPAEPAPVEEPAQVEAITTEDLIARGDSICAEVNAAVGTIDSSETADETLKATQRADIYGGLAERLTELGTPSDGQAPTAVINAARALGHETVEGDLAALQAAAGEYGFTACAEAPAAPVPTSTDGGGTDPGVGTVPDSGGYTEPAPAPDPGPAPAPDPGTGGGVAPATPDGGGGGDGSGGSGGIGPG